MKDFTVEQAARWVAQELAKVTDANAIARVEQERLAVTLSDETGLSIDFPRSQQAHRDLIAKITAAFPHLFGDATVPAAASEKVLQTADRLLKISTPITHPNEARAFIRWLKGNGLDFHFEDDPEQLINLRTREPVFSEEELPHLRNRVQELYSFHWGPDGACPIGYLIDLTLVGWDGEECELICRMAKDARPHDDLDYGSERQVDSSNRFFDYLRGRWPTVFGEASQFASWCLKATDDEMVDEALRLIRSGELWQAQVKPASLLAAFELAVQTGDIDLAVRPVQEVLGVEDGGAASQFFSGPDGDAWSSASPEQRREMLRRYVDHELVVGSHT